MTDNEVRLLLEIARLVYLAIPPGLDLRPLIKLAELVRAERGLRAFSPNMDPDLRAK